MNTDSWRGMDKDITIMTQAVKLMSSEKAHHFRGEEHFQIWIKDYEGKQFFFLLALFTTKIAMCANKINIQFWFISDWATGITK